MGMNPVPHGLLSSTGKLQIYSRAGNPEEIENKNPGMIDLEEIVGNHNVGDSSDQRKTQERKWKGLASS